MIAPRTTETPTRSKDFACSFCGARRNACSTPMELGKDCCRQVAAAILTGRPRREAVIGLAPACSDARGEIVNLPAAQHVAYITSAEGSRRAGHYHLKDWQRMVCIRGCYRAVAQEVDSSTGRLIPGTNTSQIISAGQLAICPPWLAHAYEFLAPTVFLNLTDEDRTAPFEEHTVRLEGWPA